MTAVERERPTTKEPTNWDRKGKPAFQVIGLSALIAIIALAVTWGIVVSPRDFVRVDVQAVIDKSQNERHDRTERMTEKLVELMTEQVRLEQAKSPRRGR